MKKKTRDAAFFSIEAAIMALSVIGDSTPGAIAFGALLISWVLADKEFIGVKTDTVVLTGTTEAHSTE